MDAFAVSIGKGLSLKDIKLRHYLSVGFWFGGFQALMPLIGYLLGATFTSIVSDFDHWVAFFLLGECCSTKAYSLLPVFQLTI